MPFLNTEFDPETLRRLTRAFEMAWKYLETNPDNKVYISHETAREDLALLMMNLARSGESNPIRIANLAIDQMRQSEHPPIKSEARAEDEDLSFPKIISGRIGDVARPRSGCRQ
jgi:hypothetical protein